MSEATNTGVAIEAGKTIATQGAAVHNLGGVPFVAIVAGVEHKNLEWALPTPVRKRATVAIRETASFVDYVKLHLEPSTAIFANIGDRTITAVLDYHEGAGTARWGQHRAQLTCLLTEDWKRWMAANKKRMGQVDFAQFLEDNVPNIAQPDGSTIVEIARSLDAKKSVNFSSSVRLDNGEHQLTYEENITGTSQKGTVLIPPSFTLGIAPFEGGDLYRVDARFRYRIESGVLAMWFDLIRPEAVVEDAFRQVRAVVAEAIPVKVLAAVAPEIK